MRDIYGHAEEVIVWLRKPLLEKDNQTELKEGQALELVNYLSGNGAAITSSFSLDEAYVLKVVARAANGPFLLGH